MFRAGSRRPQPRPAGHHVVQSQLAESDGSRRRGVPGESRGCRGLRARRLHGAAVRTRVAVGTGEIRFMTRGSGASRDAATLAIVVALLCIASMEAQQTVPLTAGLVIDRSITVRPGTYRLVSADLSTPAITIRGTGITVDFNGAVLAGGDSTADPDSFAGTGILIDGGSRVTVQNAIVRGYKVGIMARQSPDLHLTRNDVSYNWKQRLYSGIEKESLLDWMSYHNNEKDEWLRFGAGIYLRECDRAEIDHTTAVQGQNGLMVTHSKGLKIWNNTFQFLSSIGIGLYRVSESSIMHNKI